MKTNDLFRWIKIFSIHAGIGLCSAFMSAQCPTITNTSPLVCDATGYTFLDLSNDYVTDGGNGIVWYSVPVGGIPISNIQLVQEGTYYVDDSSGACGARQSINVTFEVDPVPMGASIDKFYCSNENATIQDYINDALALHVPIGGSVRVFYNSTLTNQANSTDLLALGIVNYFIVFDDGTCSSQIKFGKSIISESPEDPTPISSQVFCSESNPTIADLDPGTLAPDFNWYNNANAFPPALAASTPLVNGQTYYVRVEDFLCVSNLVPVTVTISTPNNPGISNNLEFCEDGLLATSFNLFDELGGGADTNGVWTGPLTTSGGYLGTVNISTLAAGIYTFTYTVPSNGLCASLSADVTIVIYEAFSSGTVSLTSPNIFCASEASASFDLFSLLENHDSGGQWTQGTLSSDPIIVNPSAINLSTLAPGTYNYTYTQNLTTPCAEESTTVQVVILQDPNAGNAQNQVFCENDLASNSPFNLFNALDGSQDNNSGVWTNANNVTISSTLDLTTLTVAGSPYSFHYTIDNGKCSDTTSITITIQPAPESGTANPPIEFCLTNIVAGQTYNLFDLLSGEDQIGTWSDDDASGALTGNMVSLDGLTQGTYNFTYDVAAVGTCDDTNVTVTIIINDLLAPTVVDTTQEFCDSATVADLVATGTLLQWYENAIGGIPLASTTALINGEDYFVSQVDAIGGCESSTRTQVIVTIYQTPHAGNPAAPLIVCNMDANIDLNTGLDGTQDVGGIWQDTDGTGALVGNIFDATSIAPGTYQFTYYVAASSPCTDDSTVITVTVEAPLSAGTDGVLDICSNDTETDLFTLIGSADTGGIWSPALASGTGVLNPSVDVSGTYTYTLTNACGTVSSEVVVNVIQAPNAGTDNTADVCVIDGIIDLFQFLGNDAQTGGTWSPTLSSGTGAFNPLVDLAGTYTYTVAAVSPCSPDASAQITVTILDSPAPIVLNANPEFCRVDNPMVSDLNIAIRASGIITWYADVTSTIPLNPTDGLVNGQDYFARQTTASGCVSSESVQITVTVNDVATPTLINPNLELCINDHPTLMELTENLLEYDSNLNNVNWYDSATGTVPLSNSSLLAYGVTYYAALYDALTGCESSVRLAYTPDVTSCGELALPDGFSPNGDGVNDTFDYNNLDILHPNFEIQIFNRYGTVVYKGNAQTPRFDGTSNQSGTLGNKPLPTGVYFYIFNFNDGKNKPKNGRLYLAR